MFDKLDNLIVLDCEVYPNFFCVCFKSINHGTVCTIQSRGKDTFIDDCSRKKLSEIISNWYTFGFNSINYDIPIILYALKRWTCNDIYKLSERIINGDDPSWKILSDFKLSRPKSMRHFDIKEPAPDVHVSLKLFGGRMNTHKLQDLPIEPGTILSGTQMDDILKYCINDLDVTIQLYKEIEERIRLRVDMSEKYGQNLISKSDAQIAEAVIKSELRKRRTFKKMSAPVFCDDVTFKYNVPEYIKFNSDKLKDALDLICNLDFGLDTKGSIKLPSELKALKIQIGSSKYQIGIGGIHSTEKRQMVVPNDNQLLMDRDVESYYPKIILNLNLYPKHLGSVFLDVYRKLVEERLEAKKAGNSVVSDILKIVINGTYGKLGMKSSSLYSPDLMIAVTLTGQLSLLMLIERLENLGISVVSANTDGIVSLIPKDLYNIYDSTCTQWEKETNFKLEQNQYKALYSRDVNNYLAVMEDGVKGKGVFNLSKLSKNPQSPICVTAATGMLIDGTSIIKTILDCRDLTKFLTVRRVNGGAVWKNEYLGKVVRWIYSNQGEYITNKKNGNKVAKSDGARPIMTLEAFPNDINYSRYFQETLDILLDCGYTNP
jgi:hypothetical protein